MWSAWRERSPLNKPTKRPTQSLDASACVSPPPPSARARRRTLPPTSPSRMRVGCARRCVRCGSAATRVLRGRRTFCSLCVRRAHGGVRRVISVVAGRGTAPARARADVIATQRPHVDVRVPHARDQALITRRLLGAGSARTRRRRPWRRRQRATPANQRERPIKTRVRAEMHGHSFVTSRHASCHRASRPSQPAHRHHHGGGRVQARASVGLAPGQSSGATRLDAALPPPLCVPCRRRSPQRPKAVTRRLATKDRARKRDGATELSIKAFGVAAPADLMVDYDHSIPFCDLDVTQLLELGARKPAVDLPQRHKSQIRYSDKKRVARFRTYAADLYDKQGMAGKVRELIGDLALNGRHERQTQQRAGIRVTGGQTPRLTSVHFAGKLTKPCDFLTSLSRWLTWGSSLRTASPSDIGTLAAAGARNSLVWGGHSRQLTQHGA